MASQGATRFIRPFTAKFEYEAVLPNVGLSYDITEEHIVYFSFAEGLSAPRTDNLYFAAIARTALDAPGAAGADANIVGDEIDSAVFPGVEPEKTRAYDLGYRFQGEAVTASAALWYNEFQNRIVTSFDADAGVTVDRNVGKVVLQGVDAELGWRATPDLTFYASASRIESELKDGYRPSSTTLVPPGTELVETPDWTFAGRVQYDVLEFLTLGVQGKYVGDRFSNDINTEIAPSYTVFDANATFDMSPLGIDGTILQVNATNIFDESYLGNISSSATGAATFSIGAPQTFQAQLRTRF